MTETPSRMAPELSVVLTTDTRATIRGVLRRLQNQTAKARLEIIMVVPHGQGAGFGEADAQGFAAFRVVEVDEFQPLSKARGAGVRAASAPMVFLGETHAYPQPNWAAALIAASQRGEWGVISPAFINGNPRGAISWAGFIADYGKWSEGLPAREIDDAPLFNSAYRRSVLMAMGERLDPSLSQGDELPLALRNRGCRAYFAADAPIAHINNAHLGAWATEIFFIGLTIGGYRARRWSPVRRAAYVAGSPLIALVLSYRFIDRIRHFPKLSSTPAAAIPLIFIGAAIRAAGEMIGYAFGVSPRSELLAERYELHKVAIAARREV